MFTRKPRLQPAEFLITGAKRLLQHNLPIGDIAPPNRKNNEAANRGGLFLYKLAIAFSASGLQVTFLLQVFFAVDLAARVPFLK